MMKVIEGKIYYRFDIEKEKETLDKLKFFLADVGVAEKKTRNLTLDLDSNQKIQHRKFSLTIKPKQNVVTLLFETTMDSCEFAEVVEEYFQPKESQTQ